MPPGWAEDRPPSNFTNFSDISIYELHVRDFSASDETVPWNGRGKFVAFAERGSAGVEHLMRIAKAGITHLHLLPVYDFGSVPEIKENQRVPQVCACEGHGMVKGFDPPLIILYTVRARFAPLFLRVKRARVQIF